MKILKKDNRSTVYDTGDGLVRKIFSPEKKLLLEVYDDDWKYHINQFAEEYGHFPKIISHSAEEITMERIVGESFEDIRNKGYRNDVVEHAQLFKKMQFLYLDFLRNLSKYNLKNKVSMYHNDLNFRNLINRKNKLVVIDPDSVLVNRDLCENSFMSFFLTRLDNQANYINFKYKSKQIKELERKISHLQKKKK